MIKYLVFVILGLLIPPVGVAQNRATLHAMIFDDDQGVFAPYDSDLSATQQGNSLVITGLAGTDGKLVFDLNFDESIAKAVDCKAFNDPIYGDFYFGSANRLGTNTSTTVNATFEDNIVTFTDPAWGIFSRSGIRHLIATDTTIILDFLLQPSNDSVAKITANGDLPVYFDLQGRPVDTPQPGRLVIAVVPGGSSSLIRY